ncbi:NAC domain-containing protein 83 [Carica papaya]|uniref:NAC domain-containing protein 83 n=1 Tax=Carica papaya TaxID=3649 RepID=UPI000B8C882F|nr:NAC domain-containing protein 83 [Carica papaya]
MAKFNFVRDGAMRLPPGFRFQPTDEELVFRYLKCKVFSFPLPASIIPDVNLCKYDPWDLPGELEQERYFFSSKEAKYRNGNRINRATVSGYWKATGSDRQISSPRKNQMVGMKKTLVFYKGKPPHGFRTSWVMHEYRLVNTYPYHNHNLTQNVLSEMEKWVICHVYMRKRSSSDQNDDGDHVGANQGYKNYNAEMGQLKFFDFVVRDGEKIGTSSGPNCSSSSSSNSSGITAASSSESDDLEESSAF